MENEYISKDKLKQIPELPGIYKMLDSKGTIIYIGKSKCLRKRVQSYFVSTPKWEKVNRMVSFIRDIEYIVTDTHLEARLLECRLIKEIQPRFNAQMKNDQRYFFIKVENYNRYNSLSIVADRDDDCFGPFRSKYAISEFLSRLKNIYPIVKTDDGYEFEYHMFPNTMTEEVFERNRTILLELLTEENYILLMMEAIQVKLEEAVAAYRFEMASIYRDMIHCFLMIKNGLDGYKSLASRDILLKLPITNGYKLFFVSNGYIMNSKTAKSLSRNMINNFLEKSSFNLSAIDKVPVNEKAEIDYRDILYSEISDLSEEMIEFL